MLSALPVRSGVDPAQFVTGKPCLDAPWQGRSGVRRSDSGGIWHVPPQPPSAAGVAGVDGHLARRYRVFGVERSYLARKDPTVVAPARRRPQQDRQTPAIARRAPSRQLSGPRRELPEGVGRGWRRAAGPRPMTAIGSAGQPRSPAPGTLPAPARRRLSDPCAGVLIVRFSEIHGETGRPASQITRPPAPPRPHPTPSWFSVSRSARAAVVTR